MNTCKQPANTSTLNTSTLDDRARTLIGAINELLTSYLLDKSVQPVWMSVFGCEQDYIEYCANPTEWAKNFIETKLGPEIK